MKLPKIEKLLTSKEEEIFGIIKSCMGEGIEGDKYLWYPSESPILFQAHIDTVRDEKKDLKLNMGVNIITANGVLGADDRAGIFVALNIMNQCKKYKVKMPQFLFTNKEECGGIGMKDFLKCEPDFGDLRLAVALDRRGASEYVTYNDIPDQVHGYISEFGFVEEWGTFSDIELFTDHTHIPSVNVSVGYYHQHTTAEQLNPAEMTLTISRCLYIAANPISKLYPVKEKKRHYDYYKKGRNGRGYTTIDWCDWCGCDYGVNKADYYGTKVYLCDSCADQLQYEITERKAYA